MNGEVGPDEEEQKPRYVVAEVERVDVDREAVFLRLLSRDPDYAARWLKSLNRAIARLADFPGPRAHAVDAAASARYGLEARRMLYHGPGKRRAATPYRVLFTVIEPAPGESEGIIRVLRILHGASDPFGPEPGSEESV